MIFVSGRTGYPPDRPDGPRVVHRCKVPLMEGWNPKRSMGTPHGEGIVTGNLPH